MHSCFFFQAGYIIKVRLKNFMNHAEYEYRPTERLNFINGSNGSGKSAVLTAIVFGLGKIFSFLVLYVYVLYMWYWNCVQVVTYLLTLATRLYFCQVSTLFRLYLTLKILKSGGSARMTNRGTANSGLIRQGQSSTTVEISLYNGGENTYKPEVTRMPFS